jgi:hypothetical protein
MYPASGIGIPAQKFRSCVVIPVFSHSQPVFRLSEMRWRLGVRFQGALRGTLTVCGIPGANFASIVTELGILEGREVRTTCSSDSTLCLN